MPAHAPRHGAGRLHGSPVTARPLVRAGRRKTARWARRAVNGTAGPDAIATADALYDELAEGVGWPRHVVLRWHLAGYLLPGVAVYRTLQTLRLPAPLAAQAVGDLLAGDALPRRRRLQRVFRTGGSYALFAAAVRLLSPIMFPAPGWRLVWLEVSRDRVAFDIDRCYYLATLTALDAAELAPTYCHVDDILYDDLAPSIEWARTGTLAAGCDRCDFRYLHTRAHPPTTAGPAPESVGPQIRRRRCGSMTRAVYGPLRRLTDAGTAGGRHDGWARPYSPAGVFVDTWRATGAGLDALRARQARRLVDLVRHTWAHSPFYAQQYAGIRDTIVDVRQLPPVTKPMLMDRFDDWVCDRAVTRTAVEAFTADPARVGEEFLGRYLVWTTSGTSGVPALLVQDRAALAVYTPVTNLANRVQPVIRYDLGDSITWHPEPCVCGSPLPAITVHGRADDVLTLPGHDHDVRILPLALGTVAEDTPGVHRAQIIQTGPYTLTVRFTTHTHHDSDTVWEQLHQRLDGYLTGQHTSRVTLERSALPPTPEVSGKYLTVQTRSHPDARPTA